MNIRQIISTDPEIMSGMTVFAGTRVPVQSLTDHMIASDGLDNFLKGFPTVTRSQAKAFLTLAFNKILTEVEYARAA